MARRDVKLLGSLVDYVKDVKPYHTKLREFASELIFNDKFNTNVIDDQQWVIHLQNVWGREHAGGHVLSKIAEGIEDDRTFRIPPTVWPHFSINDHLGQEPRGDDPATEYFDSDGDGLPDSDDPYVGSRNSSHFKGSDWIPVPAVVLDVDVAITSVEQTMWDGYVDDDFWDEAYTADTATVVSDKYVEDGYWVVGGPAYAQRDNSFIFTYDLTVTVAAELETAYGLGNYWRSFVDRVEKTSSTTRDQGGSFDQADFDGDSFDSQTRIFTITGLTAMFTVHDEDLVIFPDLLQKSPEYICRYGYSKMAPKVEIYYQNTGRYSVPFHQGSRVYVDGIQQVFGASYIVESGREFIQFLPGRHPPLDSTISVNLMKADRLFIAQVPPFDTSDLNANIGFDMGLFDTSEFDSRLNAYWEAWSGDGYGSDLEDLPFDSGYPDTVRDYFVVRVDDSYPDRVAPVAFYNSTDITGKGTLNVLKVYPKAKHGDIYLVIATGMWTFQVQKVFPSFDAPQYATFKTVFDNGAISFIVDKTWTEYYMVPDTNTYDKNEYYDVRAIYPFSKVDETDYMVNIGLSTEHGSLKQQTLSHRPVEFTSIGQVKKVADTDGNEYYTFVLNKVPPRGTYFELRVEQNGGLNPWMNANVDDVLSISVFESDTEELYLEIYNSNEIKENQTFTLDPVDYPEPLPSPEQQTFIPIGDVISDMGYDSEVRPLFSEFEWQEHPVITQHAPRGDAIVDSWTGNRPEWCYDFQSWFIVQEAIGNEASNTRVEISNLRAYYLNETTRDWTQLDVKMIPTIDRYVYPYQLEDAIDTADVRQEASGISIRPSFPSFFRGTGNVVTIPGHPSDVRAVYVAMDFRLITDNSDLPDDSGNAYYVVQVGADYFPGNSQGDWSEPNPPGIGHGRFLIAKGEWRTATLLVPNTTYDSNFYEMQYNSPPGTIPKELPSS